jgi:predicted GNAT superfamily acetyltransferase
MLMELRHFDSCSVLTQNNEHVGLLSWLDLSGRSASQYLTHLFHETHLFDFLIRPGHRSRLPNVRRSPAARARQR